MAQHKTAAEQIVANITEAREVATAALEAAKATLRAYQHAIEFAQRTVAYDPELNRVRGEAQTGRDHVSDALDAVKHYGV
jgi:hypothetical protein